MTEYSSRECSRGTVHEKRLGWVMVFIATFNNIFSRVATKSNSAYNMMNGVWASGGAIISAQYLKNKMSDLNETWYTHARW